MQDNIPIDLIYTSPLKRAYETSLIISKATAIPVMCDQRLREQSFGHYEGGSRSNKEFIHKRRQFADCFENGESLFKVTQRVYNFLDELCDNREQVILVVSHNAISRIVYSYFNSITNDTFFEYSVPNCELIRFDY